MLSYNGELLSSGFMTWSFGYEEFNTPVWSFAFIPTRPESQTKFTRAYHKIFESEEETLLVTIKKTWLFHFDFLFMNENLHLKSQVKLMLSEKNGPLIPI